MAADASPRAIKNAPVAEAPKWGAHLDLEGKWGNRRALGDIGLFAPLWQSATSLFFTDIRGRLDDQDSREGNFGFGLRHMLPSGWNAGIYGYYDARRTGNGSFFQQATLGAEMLSPDFDLRVNGYLPFGKRERITGTAGSAPFAEFANGTIEIVTPASTWIAERALRGFDAEIGWRLPVFSVDSFTQLRAYAGGFWFDGEGFIRDIAGPRGRIELSFEQDKGHLAGSRLTFGAEVQHDEVRGTNAFAVARLRIPLQPGERSARRLTPQESRMTERVVRDVDIVAGQGSKGQAAPETREAAINAYNNETVTDVVQVDAAGGHAALLTEIANYNAGSIVIANGAFAVATETELKTGQTLLGGGAQLPLIGAVTNKQVTFAAPGGAASMSGAFGGPDAVVLMADNSVVGGLSINNAGLTGPRSIYATSVAGVTIFGNTIAMTNAASTSGQAVYLEGDVHNSRVIGNSITTAGEQFGIVVAFSDDVTATGNTITTAAGTGIRFHGTANGLIAGNTIMAAGGHGIEFSNSTDGAATGNTVQSTGPGGGGITASNSTGVTVANNTFGPLLGNGSIIDAFFASTFAAGSTGNIDNTNPSATRCDGDGTASGTVSFTAGAPCTSYP
jgi:parallel beta-helix repeat protein